MSQSPENSDDLDDALHRMEQEFGPRRPRDGEADEPALVQPPPTSSMAFQPPPMQRPVRPRPLAARPRAALTLLWSIVIIYILSSVLSGGLFQPDLATLVLLGAKVNDLVKAGQYWRLITAAFLHANLIHIFFNGYALYALGPESERIYGTGRFLVLYFLAALGGSIASYALSPGVAVGASGAIFGLIGGLGIFYYLNRKLLGDFGRMQVQNMATVAILNLIIGFSSGGIIDNWGHLGGLLGGTLAGLALAPRLSIDSGLVPPILIRQMPSWGWGAIAALLVAMATLVVVLPPA